MESSAPGLLGELCMESSAPGLQRHSSAQALPGVLFSPALPSGRLGPRNPQLPVPCRILSFLCWNGKQSSRTSWCPCPLLMGWPGHVTPPLSALVMLKCRIYLLHSYPSAAQVKLMNDMKSGMSVDSQHGISVKYCSAVRGGGSPC